ncbi:MAG: outer membrane protein OmpA-like peptidoglycan-associated protein, partial [Myxococcota bacterium]
MVAQFDKEQSYTERLQARRRQDLDLARQKELQREFLLEQVDELAADFVDHPEQIGNYISDLEAAGMLGVADKGMLFRRLWETMGPAFADQAFHMTERAVDSGADIARDIAQDAKIARGERSAFGPTSVSSADAQNLDTASQVLQGFASALGLDLDLKGRPAVDPQLDTPAHIHDPDGARAKKTQALLDVLAPQLGVDSDVDVHVDEEARHQTADQGLLGLMSEGSVFLNPDVYDPDTAEGRGLLAHEVSHIAQRENQLSGATYADPSIADAERESHEIMEMFGAGNAVEAPLASLDAYDKAACGPRSMQEKEPEPNEPTREVEVIPPEYGIVEDTIEVPPIHFDFDKWNIREDAGVILGKVSQTIAAYPEITSMELEGHTDSRGNNAYNEELSDKRVHSAVDHLYNVNGVKIPLAWIGYGETSPLIPGAKTEEEHQQNRRVVFRITTVNGEALNGQPFKPTKQVMIQPGKTIIRYLDADGNVTKTEVVEDGQQAEGPPGAATDTTTDGGSASSGAGSTGGGSGGGSNSGQPIGDSTSSNAPVSQSTTDAKPAGKHTQQKGGAKAPWRRASNAIRTVAQPKAGPGGLKASSMRQATQSGGGEMLPDSVRSKFETAFGVDFSDVRIHRGSAQATGIGATAFARGSDIHFAPGRYDASSAGSQAVLGHELTHVVQQRAGRVSIGQGKGTHINAERALEAEADLLGAKAARGERVSVQGSALGLSRRAARGDAPDAIQFEGGTTEATDDASAEAPDTVSLMIAGQTISARMPSGAAPGQVRVDFSEVASPVTGLSLGSAQVTFDDEWQIERGSISASVAIGEYVRADDVTLSIEKRGEDAVIEATITGAQLNISELFDTTIDLTVGSAGISGEVTVDVATPITLGQGITLVSG